MDDVAAQSLAGLSFHHVGLACQDLEVERAAHAMLGFEAEGGVFEDEHQGSRGLFITLGAFRVELLQPLGPTSPVPPWLRRGVKMYHCCYETDDLDGALASMRRARALVVSPPAPAVAFDLRPLAFVMLPTRSLVELLQR